ncbi:MAG: CaiB/BaiF CoA-transferase family protein [Dehalococcoidia bacterium]
MYTLLEGVRVIELSVLIPCSTVGMYLADLGADVIKIESPGKGDYQREIGKGVGGVSMTFLNLNRNKRSLTVDLKKAAGRQVLRRLVQRTDIVVEGFRPGVAARLGVDYETVASWKPDIVYCALSGFGQEGPYRMMASHGANLDSVAGALPIARRADGAPSMSNQWRSLSVTAGPMLAAMTILAALNQRHAKGAGQYIDLASSDGAIAFANGRMVAAANGIPPTDWEGQAQARYNIYETADGKHVVICCLERHFWHNLCHAIGRTDLMTARESEELSFSEADEALREELVRVFRQRTRDEWVRLFIEANVAGGPVNSPDDLLTDPHVTSHRLLGETDHPDGGRITLFTTAIRLSGQEFAFRRPPPRQGQHTDEILGELGYDDAEVERLRRVSAV